MTTRTIEADEAELIARAVTALWGDERTRPLLASALYQPRRESSCVAPSFRDRAVLDVHLFVGCMDWWVVVRPETAAAEIVARAVEGRESAIADQRRRVARQRAERTAGEMAHVMAAGGGE